MTDILEVHFLEIPKLFDKDIEKDENDPVVQWMEFLDGESKGVMEVLAEKMLRRGDCIEDIVDLTELPKEKVIELKKKYQN